MPAALLLGRLRVLEEEPEAGAPLVDPRTGYRVLDASTAPPASSTTRCGDTVTVHAVWVDGARSDGEVYAEALERVRAADPSEQVALARSVQRLGPPHRRAPGPQRPPPRAGARLARRRPGRATRA